jgi:hypothetical protein
MVRRWVIASVFSDHLETRASGPKKKISRPAITPKRGAVKKNSSGIENGGA